MRKVFVFLFLIILCLPSMGMVSVDNSVFELSVGDKIYKYSAYELIPKTHTFEQRGRMQENSRLSSKAEKIKSIDAMIDIGIDKRMAFEYMYLGLRSRVDKLAKMVYNSRADAKSVFTPDAKKSFIITPHQTGVCIDYVKLYDEIYKQYKKTAIIRVTVPLVYTDADISEEYLKNITALRGEYMTDYSSSSTDRKHNVVRALQSVHGKVIMPSEEFSFNKVVGRRLPEHGYRLAKIISDGEFVDGVGGGVCQASTTLYNAVVLADLSVTSVHRHSRLITYVPPALDAMVNYGSSDLVFVNNTLHPIYITCTTTDKKVGVKIYGLNLGKGIMTKTESITTKIDPAPVDLEEVDKTAQYVKYDDEVYRVKPSKDGVTAQSYLVRYKDGREVSRRKLREESYPSERGKVLRGAMPRPVEPLPKTENFYESLFDRIFNW